MANSRTGIGAAVAGATAGVGGLVLGLSAFFTPLVVAGWIADALTSSWFLRAFIVAVVWSVFVTIGAPLLLVLCAAPDPAQMARAEPALAKRAGWRKGWVARVLAVIFVGFGAWKFPELMQAATQEASARMSDSGAGAYGLVMALATFASGTVLFASTFLLGSAFTRGIYREIVTLVFLAGWVVGIIASVVAAKMWNPGWSLYRVFLDTAAIRSLWAVALWAIAAWRLRAAYKAPPQASQQVIAT